MSLVITFGSTAAAMAAEKLLQKEQMPGRLIPVPTAISAGCGLAWKADIEAETVIMKTITAEGLTYENTYRLMV